MSKLKIGSDCSGVGAFIQALDRLGIDHEEQFACDLDKFARKTYLLNYGTKEDLEILESDDCKKIDQIYTKSYDKNKAKDITPEEWKFVRDNEERIANSFSFYYPWDMNYRSIPEEPTDVYVSTVPCQAFSIAGKRGGEKDRRGILFYTSHEYIVKNRPRYFIFENVKGLLSDEKLKGSQFGRTFNRWLELLGGKSINGETSMFPNEEAVPYHIYWKVVNAKDRGVPQNRERVFIVGIRDDSDNDFMFTREIPLEKKLKDVLETEVDDKYFLSESAIGNLMAYEKRNIEKGNGFRAKFHSPEEMMSALKVGGGGCDDLVKIKIGTLRTHNDGISIKESDNKFRFHKNDKRKSGIQGMDIIKPEGVADTVTSAHQGNVCIPVLVGKEVRTEESKAKRRETGTNDFRGKQTEYREQDHMNTLSTGLTTDNSIFDGYRIRRLTPIECFRLMDFNESFKWNVSDSQAYKMAGNSVVVQMYVDILEQLFKKT